jgi:ABC-2 type transport system permease protein
VTAPGSIYDLGYQAYDGPRLGRSSVTLGLLRMTLKAAYGIGRGGRAKIVPFGLLALEILPAVVAVGITAIASQAGAGDALEEASPIQHATYQGLTGTILTLYLAAQAPELFGRDQRYGVLPLYFSRLLTRADYALSRLGGLVLAVFLLSVLPHLLLSFGAVLSASDPLTGLAEEAPDIPRYLAVTLQASLLLSAVAALIAAWTPRRAYATAGIIAAFLIPSVISIIVVELAVSDLAQLIVLVSPADLVDGFNAAVFGTIPDGPAVYSADLPGWTYVVASVGWIVGLIGVIVRRYVTLTV